MMSPTLLRPRGVLAGHDRRHGSHGQEVTAVVDLRDEVEVGQGLAGH